MTEDPKQKSGGTNDAVESSASFTDEATAASLRPNSSPLPPPIVAPPGASAGSVFSAGQVLANRFKILRFVARGGMGEVYEAEDLELSERVAIKTARFEGSQSEHEVERFRREIQLARRVTHPNVCRTFDVFRHVVAPAAEGAAATEILVVSMELLGGETLDRRIRGNGRMSVEEALPIVTQMCAGLDAAHRVGVIHRDFKSANVMLVPMAGSSQSTPATSGSKTLQSVRTVITDFGLAHADSHPGMTLTRPGDIVGTPSYMAPEQIEGGTITAATDIYSLGIVIYEMLTGALPFAADTPLATAMKRLKAPAPSPRLQVPDIDEKWEAVVARCLEREPDQRFASTEDIAKALRGESVTMAAPTLAPSSVVTTPVAVPRQWKTSWTVAILVLATAASLAGWHLLRDGQKDKQAATTSTTAPEIRKSIAILGFKNLSGRADADSLGNVLADSLWSQLDTGQMRFIPLSQVDEMKQNMALGDIKNSLSKDQINAIHKYLGADVLVTGTYTLSGPADNAHIDWNLHLLNAVDGGSLGSVAQSGSQNDLNGVVAHTGRLVRQDLGISISAAEEARMDSSLSSNADAMRYFSDAREKLRAFDVLAATKVLQKSIEADPKFAQAHSVLADAWDKLGFETKAADEAKKAMEASSGLSTEARDLITARYYAAARDWTKAIPQFAALWTQYRDEPEYGLQLANTQVRAGKANDALITLSQVRTQSLPPGIRAQVDLAEASAESSLGNFDKQLALATAAATTAQGLGANLLLARARIQQCYAQISLGDAEKAKPLCEEAKKINVAAGDQLGAARATNDIAFAYFNAGDYPQAEPLFQEALGIAQSIGDKFDEAGALNNLANIKSRKGEHAAAEKLYEQSIAVARDRGELGDVVSAEQNLGMEYYTSGDAARGKQMMESALKTAQTLGDRGVEAVILNNQCLSAMTVGSLAEARKTCDESLAIRRELNDKANIGKTLTNSGAVQLQQGDVDAAAGSLQEALASLESVGAKNDAAWTRISLAQMSIERDRADAAIKFATDAAAELAAEKDASGEAEAHGAWASALLASGNVNAAREQADTAVFGAAASGDRGTKLDAAIVSARVDAKNGKADAAVKELNAAIKDARAAGLLQTEFEARLALGEAQIGAGKKAEGKATLRALANDAKARGYGLIARKAASAGA